MAVAILLIQGVMALKRVINSEDILKAIREADASTSKAGNIALNIPQKYKIVSPSSPKGPDETRLKHRFIYLDSDKIATMNVSEYQDFMAHFEVKLVNMYNKGIITDDNFKKIIADWSEEIWNYSQDEGHTYATSYILMQIYNNEIKKSNEKGYAIGILSNEFGLTGHLKESKLREFHVANLDYDASYDMMKSYLERLYKGEKLVVLKPETYKKRSHMIMGTEMVHIYEDWRD